MKNISLNVSAANHFLINEEELGVALSCCVAILGENLKSTRCCVYTIENECIKESYSWTSTILNDLNRKIPQDPPLNCLSKSIQEILIPLSNGFNFFGTIDEMAEGLIKKVMSQYEVETFLFIPIFDNDTFWGFLSFEYSYNVEWNYELIDSIKLFTKNISIKINEIRYRNKIGPDFQNFTYYTEGFQEGLWELDLITFETKFSNNWAMIIGFSIFEIEQTYDFWKQRVHVDDIVRVEKNLQDYISGKIDDFCGVFRMKHKNGKYIWINFSGVIKRDEKGIPNKIIGNHINVDEIQKNKIAFEESERYLRFILENSSDLISQLDINGNYIFASTASIDILGYTPNELIQFNFFDLLHPEDLETIQLNYRAFIDDTNNSTCNLTFRLRKKEGAYAWVEELLKKIIQNNSIIGLQSTSRDISLRMKLEKENQKAIAREKELYDLKTKFVAMASHQFRTPLTVIYSNAELIEMKSINIEKKMAENFMAITNRIKSEIDRMSELIENILIFGKYDTKENVTFNIEPLNFDTFLKDLLDTYFNKESDGRKMEFFSYGKVQMLQTDRSLLVHVFINLISNAFKYSKGKQNPQIIINYLEENIKIEIIDSGIGIPSKDVKNLFKSFYRASNTNTIIGSGLGLSIVKQFTLMLKGKIKISSKENLGTQIIITFPYE